MNSQVLHNLLLGGARGQPLTAQQKYLMQLGKYNKKPFYKDGRPKPHPVPPPPPRKKKAKKTVAPAKASAPVPATATKEDLKKKITAQNRMLKKYEKYMAQGKSIRSVPCFV